MLTTTKLRTALALSIMLCLFVSLEAVAQEEPAADIATSKNSLVKGAWAMQFGISSNFTLKSFQGSTISLKKHTSAGRAIRIGLGLSGDFSDRDQTSRYNTIQTDHDDTDRSSYTVEVDLMKIMYTSPTAAVNFFWGVGPTGYHRYVKSARSDLDPPDRKDTNTGIEKMWQAGLGVALGVEWFPHRNLSLMAEYGTSLTFYRTSVRSARHLVYPNGLESYNLSSTKTQGFSFSANPVKFGLSVYF